jgi:hypothetical protein
MIRSLFFLITLVFTPTILGTESLPSHVKYIEEMETPILLSAACFSLPFMYLAPSDLGLLALVPLGCASLPLAHLECMKLLVLDYYHGKELQSYYEKKPNNALYEIQVTIKAGGLLKTLSFQNKNPRALIPALTNTIQTWIEKNQCSGTVTIILTPSITTNRGKTKTFPSRHLTWRGHDTVHKAIKRAFCFTENSFQNGSYTKQAHVSAFCTAANLAFFILSLTAIRSIKC